MTRDREALQSWYRDAMLRRIDELLAVREGVEAGSTAACEELRRVGQALRGSGGTFGFPELTAAARLVEATTDREAPRRLEGLLVELRRLAGARRGESGRIYEWLARRAGDSVPDGAVELDAGATTDEAWAAVTEASGLTERALARRVAESFDLDVATLTARSRSARRLVPEAFMAVEGIVPVVEDSTTITVATADPVSLGAEFELRRLTGRTPVFAVATPTAIREVLAEASSPEPVPAARRRTGQGSEAVPDTPSAHEGDAVGRSVLVVDDDRSARLMVQTLLEKRGFEAVEASNGLEALEVMRSRGDIGLAVVDLKMPEMDGLELIWELRDIGRWSDLPVIVVTGERDEILEAQIMEEGADDYIRKPVDPRLFLARVEATLRRARHGSTA